MLTFKDYCFCFPVIGLFVKQRALLNILNKIHWKKKKKKKNRVILKSYTIFVWSERSSERDYVMWSLILY